MGNGPGNIKEYIDAFYKYPKLQGGFIWEWANHGLLTKDKQTGEDFYAYGGDFGDTPNDSTFVMDGLLNSDHTPTPGLTEYKKAIEPVQFLEVMGNKAKFINRYDFITLDHLLCWTSVSSATGRWVSIPHGVWPGQTFELEVPEFSDSENEIFFDVSFRSKATPCLAPGFEVATAQIRLRESNRLEDKAESDNDNLSVSTSTGGLLDIDCSSARWSFSTVRGNLVTWWKKHEHTGMIQAVASNPPEISFFRAPTDNDIRQDGQDWKDALLHLAKPFTYKVEWAQPKKYEFTITVHQRVAPPVFTWSIDCILTYHFHSNGLLKIKVSGTPKGDNLPRTLPRIGLVMELPKEWWRGVEWYGRGPGESYRDSKLSQKVGTYYTSSKTGPKDPDRPWIIDMDDLWTDYEVPQESSNHTDTRWLKITHENPSHTLFAQFVKPGGKERSLFDFQVSHYKMQDVADAKHPHELRKKRSENMVLRLDFQHHGLGTGSCGPKTLPEYSLLTEPFEFEVLLQ